VTEEVFRTLATKAMTQIARELRGRETSAEDRLWFVLRDRRFANLKFRRQHPIAGTAYVVDFLCYAARLVIEVDGSIHDTQAEDDRLRQETIEALGYRVIRFSNDDVTNRLQGVLIRILEAVQEQGREVALTPGPSPSGRGEMKRQKFETEPHYSKNVSKSKTPTDSLQVNSGSPLPEGEGLGVRADDTL
jgi:adenine-specific DNA-methyltransferase